MNNRQKFFALAKPTTKKLIVFWSIMQNEKIIEKLNSKISFVRKTALKEIKKREQYDSLLVPNKNLHEINLNVHTDFSFSPYSPTMAAYMAYKNGVKIACACDYGTEYGGTEFIDACNYLGVSAISGFEVTLSEENKKECLCAIYCITPEAMAKFKPLLSAFREACLQRAKKVCEKINKKLRKYDIEIDYEKDVYKFVKGRKGATLTLKHVYMAAGKKLQSKFGKGRKLAEFLRTSLCLDIQEGEYNLLCDANNPFYKYDLISTLRHNFDNIEGGLTPPAFADYLAVAKEYGAVVAYEYVAPNNWLKNQTESERTLQEFKDMVDSVKSRGFNAVCISSLNISDDMIVSFTNVLKEKQMIAIFAEKTEYPRSHFVSVAPRGARPYIEKCAYALLGNNISMNINQVDGLFTQKSVVKCEDFLKRLTMFAQIGRNSDNYEG